jgi:hypothetical protein
MGLLLQPHVSESRRTRLQTTPVGAQANDTTGTLSRWHEFNGNPGGKVTVLNLNVPYGLCVDCGLKLAVCLCELLVDFRPGLPPTLAASQKFPFGPTEARHLSTILEYQRADTHQYSQVLMLAADCQTLATRSPVDELTFCALLAKPLCAQAGLPPGCTTWLRHPGVHSPAPTEAGCV